MNILRTIKSIALAGSLLAVTGLSATAAATPNTSSYSLSVSGNTVSVYETNAEAVNAIGANFVYTGSSSAFNISATAGSTFDTCVGGVTAYSLNCAILGGSATAGTHLVASLTFTPKDTTSDASVTVSMSSSSQILSSTDNTDTLNHAALPSTSYSYTAPAPNTGDDSTVSTRRQSTTANNAAASSTPVDTPASIATSNTSSSTDAGKANTSKKASNSHVGTISTVVSALVVLCAAAAYWFLIHKRTELAPVKAYKLDAATTASKNKPAKKKPATKKSQATKKPVAKKKK